MRPITKLSLLVATAAVTGAFAPAASAFSADSKCSISTDDHLLNANRHHLSWQVASHCGSFVSVMKLTYSVLKDGHVWYGGRTTRDGTGDLSVSDTPRCAAGVHKYQVAATLTYFYLTDWHDLADITIPLKCRG